jgi:hypothetical protein
MFRSAFGNSRANNLASLFLSLVASLAAYQAWTQPRAQQPLTVTATVARDHAVPIVIFSILNNSPKAVSLQETPWANQFGVVMALVDRDTGDAFKRLPLIEDQFGPSPILQLSTGKSLQGNVDLSVVFAGLKEASKGRNLLLFWYYRARASNGEDLGTYGGWIELPRGAK